MDDAKETVSMIMLCIFVFFSAFGINCLPASCHQSTNAKCGQVCSPRPASYDEPSHVCACDDGRAYRMSVTAREIR